MDEMQHDEKQKPGAVLLYVLLGFLIYVGIIFFAVKVGHDKGYQEGRSAAIADVNELEKHEKGFAPIDPPLSESKNIIVPAFVTDGIARVFRGQIHDLEVENKKLKKLMWLHTRNEGAICEAHYANAPCISRTGWIQIDEDGSAHAYGPEWMSGTPPQQKATAKLGHKKFLNDLDKLQGKFPQIPIPAPHTEEINQ